jgi:hypothetical protein
MKLGIYFVFGAVYALAAVGNYRALIAANACRDPDRSISEFIAIVSSASWPASVLVAGIGGALFGNPGIFACNAEYSRPKSADIVAP